MTHFLQKKRMLNNASSWRLQTLSLLGVLFLAAPASAAVQVEIKTTAGTLTASINTEAAPVTACNFLRYVRTGAYDGGEFFRTVRSDAPVPGLNQVPIDVVQARAAAGVEHDQFGPIPLERTSSTGLSHRAGALSMARLAPDSATSSFFIVTQDSLELDFGGKRYADGQGFAVFGQVLDGLPILRRIQLGEAEQEQLKSPVVIEQVMLSPQETSKALAACGE